MENISLLPPIQAGLNATALLLILAGYYFVRNDNKIAHRLCMLGAFAVSALFLVTYFIYHVNVGYAPFMGQGVIRPIYFTILGSHVILAALIVPLVLVTVGLAVRSKYSYHRRIARWTFPIWIYVSATGVLIYVLAFHAYPR